MRNAKSIPTVVALHAGVHNGARCDIENLRLVAIPVVHLVKCEGLGRLVVIALGVRNLRSGTHAQS